MLEHELLRYFSIGKDYAKGWQPATLYGKQFDLPTIHKSTKTRLRSIKGKKDWETFLEELYFDRRSVGRKKILSQIA
jgi:hypothetical protein